MPRTTQNLYGRVGAGILVGLACAYVIGSLATGPWPLPPGLPGLLTLLGGALATALVASRGGAGVPRLTIAFVLAAAALYPPPAALLVALAGLLVARRTGVVGPGRSNTPALASNAAAVVVLERVLAVPEVNTGLGAGVWMALAFLLAQGVAFAVRRATAGRGGGLWRDWRRLGIEALAVPLAWLAAGAVGRTDWSAAGIIAASIVGTQILLVRQQRSERDLRRSRRALASRLSELDTLHAIGREILSSVDVRRVYRTVDRECRKIFDVDACFIALAEADRSNFTVVYRRDRGESPRRDEVPLDRPLADLIFEHKRGIQVEDFRGDDRHGSLRLDLGQEMRAALAVPLIVEGRVVGLLCVLSRTAAVYDTHQLSVLTTIAQQSAVAIENAKHYQMATVDSLTGFFLRDYFFGRLEDEYRRVRRYGGTFSLLMLDLDGFKAINDRHGHLAGDQYLRDVSRRIRAELRAADLPCRYGGDEFCLLLPETDLPGARVIAERIRTGVAATIVGVEEVAVRTTTSIGMTAYPAHDAADVSALLRNADEALYRAKRSGRDRVVPFAA